MEKKNVIESLISLNPCFNGRCTSTYTYKIITMYKIVYVLILVLMEDALVHHILAHPEALSVLS